MTDFLRIDTSMLSPAAFERLRHLCMQYLHQATRGGAGAPIVQVKPLKPEAPTEQVEVTVSKDGFVTVTGRAKMTAHEADGVAKRIYNAANHARANSPRLKKRKLGEY